MASRLEAAYHTMEQRITQATAELRSRRKMRNVPTSPSPVFSPPQATTCASRCMRWYSSSPSFRAAATRPKHDAWCGRSQPPPKRWRTCSTACWTFPSSTQAFCNRRSAPSRCKDLRPAVRRLPSGRRRAWPAPADPCHRRVDAERPHAARAHPAEPAQQRAALHRPGHRDDGLPALRRPPAHRGQGQRHGHSARRPGNRVPGVRPARQPRACAAQGPGARTGNCPAPHRVARSPPVAALRAHGRGSMFAVELPRSSPVEEGSTESRRGFRATCRDLRSRWWTTTSWRSRASPAS